MKSKFLCAGLVLAVLFTIACNSARKVSDAKSLSGETPFLNRQWMLKSLDSFTADELVKAKAYIDLKNIAQEKGSAKAGCNTILFKAVQNGDDGITFTNAVATRKFCQDFMALERALTVALSKITSYEINAHTIRFFDGNKKVLVEAVAADWD